ncbi:MAG: glycosyl hydrolase 53 family protein [Prevotella sp.]|nr:glycosyl hydrolase 53 family protein [Candidatus Equicola stercoris]
MNYKVFFSAFIIFITALLLPCCGGSGDDTPTPPVPPTPPTPKSAFMTGADISWYTEMEAKGYQFQNTVGVNMSCPKLMRDYGMDIIRLRVWVNPVEHDNWCNKADVLTKALAVKDAGMEVMIDFHYSDWWADPGKQYIPEAWKGHSVEELKTDIATHTKDILNALKEKDVTPAYVQIGNETDDGFLWETARASKNPANYAALLQSGYKAVKSVFPETKVIIHISNAYKLDTYQWQIKDIFQKYNVDYDIIGMSLYPSYQEEMGATACIDKYISNVKTIYNTYKKECMLVEVGLPVDDASSAALMKDILEKSKNHTDGHCLGVLYWEPESWSGWGYGLGASTANGKNVRPNAILNVFKEY